MGGAVRSLSDAGIVCIIAAGNEQQNISNPINQPPIGDFRGKRIYPACFRFPNNITVGSINSDDTKSSFSNYSSEWVDIAAPGHSIYSTNYYNSYGTKEGTSMSAGFVSGVAAILCAAFPDETAAQIKGRIIKGARNVPLDQNLWRNGLLDAAAAYGIESTPAQDEPMTSVRISGVRSILVGQSSFISNIKSPLNANGSFSYLWEVSNKSLIGMSESNNPLIEITALSEGRSTITLTVVQTLRDGTKITKSDTVEISVVKGFSSGSSSGGCNLGLLLVSMLLALPILRMKK
jgi:subtilisin family serine protease